MQPDAVAHRHHVLGLLVVRLDVIPLLREAGGRQAQCDGVAQTLVYAASRLVSTRRASAPVPRRQAESLRHVRACFHTFYGTLKPWTPRKQKSELSTCPCVARICCTHPRIRRRIL